MEGLAVMDQQETLIVGVFENETEARRILDSLRNSGFAREDLGLALREGSAPTTNLVQDLMQLGQSPEEAQFYYQEMQAGKVVASIRTSDRSQEVRDLLQISGAYNYESHTTSSVQPDAN
jgi:hypothetical protein